MMPVTLNDEQTALANSVARFATNRTHPADRRRHSGRRSPLKDRARRRNLEALARDLPTALTAADRRPRAQVVAAAADLLESDPELRHYALSRFVDRPTEVALRGHELSTGLDAVRCARYELTAAARACTQRALPATGVGHTAASLAETLWCGLTSRLTRQRAASAW
jgi:hypothetical protein